MAVDASMEIASSRKSVPSPSTADHCTILANVGRRNRSHAVHSVCNYQFVRMAQTVTLRVTSGLPTNRPKPAFSRGGIASRGSHGCRDCYLVAKSSGFRRMTFPRPFVKTPSRCHAVSARLTVNGVTLAADARSSFPTRISIPLGPCLPTPQARLTSMWAMRPDAPSELSETWAPINDAILSVPAMESSLSNKIG